MLFHIVGAGPSGLYLAYLLKQSDPKRAVRVFEQNRANVTFGFGVVLSGRALQFLAEGSADVVERLKDKMEHWPNQYIVHRGQRVVVDGSSFSAIGRVTLLRELQKLCAEAGVELTFERRAPAAADVADCDVLVGADGANSAIRDSHADGFGTCVADFAQLLCLVWRRAPLRRPDLDVPCNRERRVRRASLSLYADHEHLRRGGGYPKLGLRRHGGNVRGRAPRVHREGFCRDPRRQAADHQPLDLAPLAAGQ